MRVLLDENLPQRLRLYLAGHDVVTTGLPRMGRLVEWRVGEGGGRVGL